MSFFVLQRGKLLRLRLLKRCDSYCVGAAAQHTSCCSVVQECKLAQGFAIATVAGKGSVMPKEVNFVPLHFGGV